MRRQPHRGRGGTHHVGRVRIQAAEILSASLGYPVAPEDIHPATGAWRTDWRLDVYRWELYTKTATGMPVVAGCWDSLTVFVRESKKLGGCHLKDGEVHPGKPTV